ncbi:hypothetical protein M011DRAFT_461645 [Sporormia fimetaria CBS 119925]|uniref:C2H2-type domain-containing protein n=1 Tax=Sporormia fimetaria CBS 119925 TaxID=1340428 RepID=A0A6A6V267_9PLEO|nr:hypothetical protein M011DRAFT_461645 [Sporormia fimetaria CBS 119925]
MARIHDLPEELLEQVLQFLKEISLSKEFWAAIQTCRAWHRVGLGVHKDLHLSLTAVLESASRRRNVNYEGPDTAINLTTNLIAPHLRSPSQLYVSELRSLTVHILHARIAGQSASANEDLLTSLTDVFKTTRKLEMLSLKFADDGWDFPHNDVPAVPGSTLARLIGMLPLTVNSLEIDTAGVDVPPLPDLISEDDHLCTQISRILPRLRHLRLRVGHICSELISSARERQLRPCPCEEGCECCAGPNRALCALTRSWNLKTLTIWLSPRPGDECCPFKGTLRALDRLSPTHGTTTTIISQNDGRYTLSEVTRGYFHPAFTWKRETYDPVYQAYEVRGHIFEPFALPPHKHSGCTEHALLTSGRQRSFQLGEDAFPKTPFPYVAAWMLEGHARWAQNTHRGRRYPASDCNDTPSFSCLVPGCRHACQTLNELRGHHIYEHESHLVLGQWNGGVVPCPSVGCDRVGSRGFAREEDLEKHLLEHHVRPCTLAMEKKVVNVSVQEVVDVQV